MEFMALAVLGTAALVIGPMVFTAWENRKRR